MPCAAFRPFVVTGLVGLGALLASGCKSAPKGSSFGPYDRAVLGGELPKSARNVATKELELQDYSRLVRFEMDPSDVNEFEHRLSCRLGVVSEADVTKNGWRPSPQAPFFHPETAKKWRSCRGSVPNKPKSSFEILFDVGNPELVVIHYVIHA